MPDQPLHGQGASAASSAVTAEPQSGPVVVPEGVEGEVSGEPQAVEVQSRQRVLHHTRDQSRQTLRAAHVARVVEFIV